MKILIIFLSLLCLCLLWGCDATMTCNAISCINETAGFHISISSAEAHALVSEDNADDSFFIIDLRTPQEFEDGYIKGAELINFYDDDFSEQLADLDRDASYFIYCRSGRRSAASLAIMKSMGFTKVYNLRKGIDDWVLRGYTLEE